MIYVIIMISAAIIPLVIGFYVQYKQKKNVDYLTEYLVETILEYQKEKEEMLEEQLFNEQPTHIYRRY